ncbi:MAG: zinc ribbon domain-containing protein, partial [SAR324 cluster bacterium]|nr:zinc ribbon domain-containing protein [SAR324 cluster bacterium]
MDCGKCGHSNRAEARFCEGCGASLERLCPSCGNAVTAQATFCDACGHSLSAKATPSEIQPPAAQAEETPSPATALEGERGQATGERRQATGERRQATVLFSDLSGYTAMNEKLDPEEVQDIMGRIKSEAVKIVEEHGGIVNQFVGDEVLALFGIPAAHKDDPRRAVQAALELHKLAKRVSPEVEERIGAPLRMHTGINTGLIVTNLRDTRDGTYGITGDTVNTGARLKVLAKDDTILVSPDTQREIAPYFETTALEARELKGKGQPMAPFRIVGEMRGQKVGQQGFVGRQAELRQFASVIEACLESGQGQAVYVRGEAGIGKTHFVEECRRIAVKGGFACHSGLTLDFGIGKGRDAIRAIVRSMLGIAPGSGKEIRRAAAQRAIAGGLLGAETEPYLNDLLDYHQPPEWRAI